MITRLLPNSAALPVWRSRGIRALESRLQAERAQPLMDLAGLATAQLALAIAPHARQIWILAGPGNNGGDGLEAAMHLHQQGMPVHVSLLGVPERLPTDARRALDRATRAGVPIHLGLPAPAPELTDQDLCIDALLGIGANRAPEGEILRAIQWINASSAKVLAIDIPTGLDTDSGQTLIPADAIVRADHTLTLIGAKVGLLTGHGRDASGTIWLAPLGLPPHADQWVAPDARLNPPAPASARCHASHKGTRGDVAIVGGEPLGLRGMAMEGAALLAAQSALHAGAGRVMLCLLGPTASSLATPDLMQRTVQALELSKLTVVAGCGGGQAIAGHLGHLIQHSARLVLDADGLNRLAEDPWLQNLLAHRARQQQPTLVTPHPLEAARLLGSSTAEVQANRLQAAQALADRLRCCVVLKGSGTVIAAPDHTPHVNPTGNGLLATGGTGDVLAGLMGARLALHGQAWQAACESCWSHGQLADQWPTDRALTASRLARQLH